MHLEYQEMAYLVGTLLGAAVAGFLYARERRARARGKKQPELRRDFHIPHPKDDYDHH